MLLLESLHILLQQFVHVFYEEIGSYTMLLESDMLNMDM